MIANYKIHNLPELTPQGLYDPSFEKDACGVGLVANIKGMRSPDLIRHGLEILTNLGHRGAAGADPHTGDGAGMLIQLPHQFMSEKTQELGISLPSLGEYGVGMSFLPRGDQEAKICQELIHSIIKNEGLKLLGWRDVPVSRDTIGVLAARVCPQIKQFFVVGKPNSQYSLETQLYILRKQIENTVSLTKNIDKDDFYICSLSTNKIVYKGLVMAHQLGNFYTDLADPNMTTAFALVHSRFSTNTLGSWKLAHPYRHIIHNGEINTLRGNINWMTAREKMFYSTVLGKDVKKLIPVVTPGQSDTASLDNALELLLASGRSIEHSLMMLVPEAWGDHIPMSKEKRDFYEFHSSLMEPWDGPALIIGTDGQKVCAVLDRNGLRPCRYMVTTDDLLVMASETGVLNVPPENVLFKERIYPGRMFMLDTSNGLIIEDAKLKSTIANRRPYGDWLSANRVMMGDLPFPENIAVPDFNNLLKVQKSFGYTLEDLRIILMPMASSGYEPIGSMGTDTPLAILSGHNPLLFNYFKQLFAQVSNPPLDAIREELVTSLRGTLGAEVNLLDESPKHCRQLTLLQPVINNIDLEKIRRLSKDGLKATTLSTLFRVTEDEGNLERALDRLCREATAAISSGYSIIILSDRGVSDDNVAIPSLLATSAVHHHLIREGTRTKTGLVIETGEAREVAHFALLIGYGAGAVNPYLALDTIQYEVMRSNSPGKMDHSTAEQNYFKAVHKGILKVMSKMGISTIQSYRGAQIFEAIGLNRRIVERYFTWTSSRINGIGLAEIEKETIARHSYAYEMQHSLSDLDLSPGGQYQWRRDGEYHMWNPESISLLQHAVRTESYTTYRQFAETIDEQNRQLCTIRGLLEFNKITEPIPVSEVESASEIVKRFATGAASLGSISREAHETMAIAMNRIGARSNTGEGGEDYHRYTPDTNGDARHSAIKQVASGRFGVTINYLTNATDLQIKMAQGSKPGEGGQLPGHKVDEYIGWVRNSTPGVELISPPPHHDIYSIEDLAQLIHDLKNANPNSRIHVKLVAEAGVGTIAAGVAKGHGDVVLISGDSGGTGASPESSVKHAGLPWELGVAETQQVLVMNDLRGRIVVQTDGQLKTGRDVAIACLLGAEEFGFATAPLITMGCIMLRKCHLNTCSVGIATQNPELREKFVGQPEHVINYFFYVAEHLREIMADLGFRTVNEMVGRSDKLSTRKNIDHWKASGIDLSDLLHKPKVPTGVSAFCSQEQDHGLSKALDNELIDKCKPALDNKKSVTLRIPITNANRTVATTLSYEIARRYGEDGLPNHTINIDMVGSAGQSFAAFLNKGISITLEGDANDYFCKGLSGGRVVIKPPAESTFVAEENILVGNVVLYGATAGKVFIRGIAGERFAVRNSGADCVVEGVGDHGCEYMTGGKVVVLGLTGRNFAAGMSGGVAYVFDEMQVFKSLCNTGMVSLENVTEVQDLSALKRLIEDHFVLTESANAQRILTNWQAMSTKFVKVMPNDYKRVLMEREAQEI